MAIKLEAIDIFLALLEREETSKPLPDEPVPERPGPELTPTHWLEKYWVKNRGLWYYRYCQKLGKRIRHWHIPGGNTRSGTSTHRAALVEEMIRLGTVPELIEQQIQAWRRSR